MHVDPGNPNAWRRSPFYENLKRWAAEGVQKSPDMHLVDVLIGEHVIVILPDREVDLGVMREGETITLERKATPQGFVVDVRKKARELVPV